MDLVSGIGRNRSRIEITVVGIDYQITFGAISGSHQHGRAKGLACISGLVEEQGTCPGRLAIGHVQRLRAVGSDPLPIIDNYTRGRWINLPGLPGLGPASSAVHRSGNCYVSDRKARDVEIAAGRDVR